MSDEDVSHGLPEILTMRELDQIPMRDTRDDHPILMDRSFVKVRGEELDAIWWQGRQWAVTRFGLEARDGTYTIAAARLTENITTHAWPAHVTGKTWVDSDDFTTAWLVALAMHGAKVSGKAVRDAVAEGIMPNGQ